MNNIITWKKYIVKASFAAREGFLDLFSKNFRFPESNNETKCRSGIGFRLREFWKSYRPACSSTERTGSRAWSKK